MKYTNLREAPHKIAALEEFKSNTLRGYWTTLVGHKVYVVKSFQTIIAVYAPEDGTLYLNDWHYSIATVRHKGTLWLLTQEANYVIHVTPTNYTADSAEAAMCDALEDNQPVTQR